MIEEKPKEKEYKLRQLEKLIDEQKYYFSSKENIHKFIDESSQLLNNIKKHTLNETEIKQVSKMVSWISKLRRYLR